MATDAHSKEHDWQSTDYVDNWIATDKTKSESFNLLLTRIISYIPHPAAAPLRILDIGGGYGALSQKVLESFPNASVVLHDFSQPMLTQAGQRLSWAAARTSFVRADLSNPGWNRAIGGQFDVVVSARAIHNIRLPERIRSIYREIFPLVKAGGCFLNCDLIHPATQLMGRVYIHATAMATYYDRLKAQAGEEKSFEEIEQEVRQRHSRWTRGGGDEGQSPSAEPATLENQLRWFREAGFDDSDCLWKDLQRAILGGYRK